MKQYCFVYVPYRINQLLFGEMELRSGGSVAYVIEKTINLPILLLRELNTGGSMAYRIEKVGNQLLFSQMEVNYGTSMERKFIETDSSPNLFLYKTSSECHPQIYFFRKLNLV